MRDSYIYVSNKDLCMIKSPLDNILRGVFDDKGNGVQAKGNITNQVRICSQNGRIFERKSDMKELTDMPLTRSSSYGRNDPYARR